MEELLDLMDNNEDFEEDLDRMTQFSILWSRQVLFWDVQKPKRNVNLRDLWEAS